MQIVRIECVVPGTRSAIRMWAFHAVGWWWWWCPGLFVCVCVWKEQLGGLWERIFKLRSLFTSVFQDLIVQENEPIQPNLIRPTTRVTRQTALIVWKFIGCNKPESDRAETCQKTWEKFPAAEPVMRILLRTGLLVMTRWGRPRVGCMGCLARLPLLMKLAKPRTF